MPALFDCLYREYCRARLAEMRKQLLIRPVSHEVLEVMVESHCAALEGCAAAMKAAGVGTHPSLGHIHVLRRMSDGMRAEAAIGKVPHIFPHIWRGPDSKQAGGASKSTARSC